MCALQNKVLKVLKYAHVVNTIINAAISNSNKETKHVLIEVYSTNQYKAYRYSTPL